MANQNYGTYDAGLIAKIVAMMALKALRGNLKIANLINRDYSPEIASFGDTVNVTLTPTFAAEDRTDGTASTVLGTVPTKTQVVLNKWKSVTIQTGDLLRGVQIGNLEGVNLDAAMTGLVEAIESDIMGTMYPLFTTNAAVGAYNTALTEATVVAARTELVSSKAPIGSEPAFLVVTPTGYGSLLQIPRYTERQRLTTGNIPEGVVGMIDSLMVVESQYTKVTSTNHRHGMAFTRSAALFVNRPLPKTQVPSVIQQVVQDSGYTIRATWAYDKDILAEQMTVDCLYGVAAGREQYGVEVAH